MSTKTPKRRLGRGLSSLISAPVEIDVTEATTEAAAAATPRAPAAPEEDGGEAGARIEMLALEAVSANPKQPRTHFDEQALDSLATSIRAAGVMQPIIVRPVAGGRFELIAGERRWRAARRAALDAIPAIVRDLDDRQTAEWSLIENVQREDLNPIERAEAFQRLADDFGLTHREIAEHVGLDRTSVTNHLRLLELDPIAQEAVRSGRLGMGHGRCLLAAPSAEMQRSLVKKAIAGAWSVRALERRVRALSAGERASSTEPAPVSARRANTADLERRLGAHLGTRVTIRPGRKKGTGDLVVSFYSLDQFEGLMERLDFHDRDV